MKTFHHNDPDGRLAAFCVLHYYNQNTECFEINYNIPFPFDKIQKDEEVWIVDFSIKPDEMKKLLEITSNVVWCDHHKTSIAAYKDFGADIKGLRQDGLAGCVLTYMFIHGLKGDTAKEVPFFIQLVGDWDAWTWNKPEGFGEKSKRFYHGLFAHDTNPHAKVWKLLAANEDEKLGTGNVIEGISSQGDVVLNYRKEYYRNYLKSWGRECTLKGYKCIAMNSAQTGSESFESVFDKGYDIFISYVHDGKKFVVSLYSTTVDVSEIAKSFGGGGHVGASGMEVKELPF